MIRNPSDKSGVKRAVDLVRAGKAVTRGTLGTQFVQAAFDELRRLGLQVDTEAEFRKQKPGKKQCPEL